MNNPVSVGDDLVGDLRDCRDLRKNGALSLPAVNAYMQKVYSVRHKAADRIEVLEAQLKAFADALEDYEESEIHLSDFLAIARAALNPKAPS